MATEEAVPAPNDVTDSFVKQYYHILGHLPDHAQRFYVDGSVVSRPAPDGTMLSFKSVEAINEQILSLDYGGSTFELLSVDSQHSLEHGILAMVIGFVTGRDNLKRKFSQMFYLGHRPTSYVVLNDIFRFIDDDDEASAQLTIPVVESAPATETAKPADELKKTEAVQKSNVTAVEKSVNAAEVKNVVAEATPPLDNGKMKPSDETAVPAQKPKEPTAASQRSYAAIVQSLAKNTAPFQVKAPVQKPKYTGQPRAATAPQPSAAVSNSEKKNFKKIVEEPGTSIFVANLPMNAMPPQLYELFKDFGPIKEDGIQVRSTRASGICFGFVAFESAASVHSVLEAAKNNPFMLADRKLRVKEKEVNYAGNKASGGKGGGGSRTQNGSADGGDELRRNRNRRNGGRNERRGERNGNGDSNQKSNEGGAPEVKA